MKIHRFHHIIWVMGLVIVLGSTIAGADPGDVLTSFVPTPSGNGRAVAFDPSARKLYYTITSSTNIFITDANNTPATSINPGVFLASLSWDAKRGVLWGGSRQSNALGNVYRIAMNGAATLQFKFIPPGGNCYNQTPGIIDGLAYDEGPTLSDSDDSLWIGDDGGFQIHRVNLSGNLIASFNVPRNPRSGNVGCRTGIAVDGDFLWLGLQSGPDQQPHDIVKVVKSDPTTLLESFPFSNTNIPGPEGLALDTVTVPEVRGLWSDQFGGVNQLKLWEIGPNCINDFDVGNVAVVFVDDSYLSDEDNDGRPEVNLQKLARRFYCSHSDNFDFVTVFSSFAQEGESFFEIETVNTSPAFYLPVKNEIVGLGPMAKPDATDFDPNDPQKSYCCFDGSSLYGSSKLEGIINMKSVGQWPKNPKSNDIRFLGSFTSTLDVLGQEVGHRWGSFVRFSKDDKVHSMDLLGRGLAHWSFFLDSDGSVLEGNNWKHFKTFRRLRDVFVSTSVTKGYSPLDLYLMGLFSKEKVPNFFYISDPTDPPLDGPAAAPFLGANTRGTRVDVSIDDVVASVLPRSPGLVEAPKQFRQAFILLVRTGETVNNDDIKKVDSIRKAWGSWFKTATRGRGLINTSLL